MAFRPRFWQRFWERAPRQLQVNKEGKVILGIAIAVGLAAINTGNNLLFLCWGILLSAIVLSGVLSEACLRVLQLKASIPVLPRAEEEAIIEFELRNTGGNIPAFAVEIGAVTWSQNSKKAIPGPFHLKVLPKTEKQLFARFVPRYRGFHQIEYSQAQTSYPFGFFTKSRRFGKKEPVAFWVGPRRIQLRDFKKLLISDFGLQSANKAGMGEDFFALTPYQEGDDLRRVHWLSSARSPHWMIRQNEALAGRRVLFTISQHNFYEANPAKAEELLATLGSAAEQLIGDGFAVGISGPGFFVPPAGFERQLEIILLELAKMSFGNPIPRSTIDSTTVQICLAHRGARVDGVVGNQLWVEDCLSKSPPGEDK